MPITKRTFLFLAVSSLFLALALFLYQFESARGRSLEEQKQEINAAEQQLTQLRRDIERYESTRGQFGQNGAIARHEKVSISSRFSPGELPRINDMLTHAYEVDGFLLLRNFSLHWDETGSSGNTPGQAGLSLELNGEKVFTH